MKIVEKSQETVQSVISYVSGGGLAGFSKVAEVEGSLQTAGIALGVAVVAVRLVHDVHRYLRWVKNGRKS